MMKISKSVIFLFFVLSHPTFHASIVQFFYPVVSFFADSVVCVWSVADCMVSVYSFASGCVLDCLLTKNTSVFVTPNAPQKNKNK